METSESKHDHDIVVIVNGTKHKVEGEELSYAQLVKLAFDPVPTGPNVIITITYRHGPEENPKGSLQPGQTVRIKNEMIFNVTATDKS